MIDAWGLMFFKNLLLRFSRLGLAVPVSLTYFLA